jgi:hypothetical protein
MKRPRNLIPRQLVEVHATCCTPRCTRRGLDVLPTLTTCPACGQPLDLVPQERVR